MTVFIGGVAGWLFFVGGLVCWYLNQLEMSVVLLVGAYLCETYSSNIVIRQSARTLRHAAQVLEEARKRSERGGRA